MKKSVIVFCLVIAAFSLTAFGYQNWNQATVDGEPPAVKPVEFKYDLLRAVNKPIPELVYNVDSRFIHQVTKATILNAKSIEDILPPEATEGAISFQSSGVSFVNEDVEFERMKSGENEILNAEQKKLLQSVNYSDDIYIRADFEFKDPTTGKLRPHYLTYYITVVPEKEAEFVNGIETFTSYLKENTKDKITIIDDEQLEPGRFTFVVTKKGAIENVELGASSGYPAIDKKLVKLISDMPGKWIPATNAKGEKVDQKLIFFFGKQGC